MTQQRRFSARLLVGSVALSAHAAALAAPGIFDAIFANGFEQRCELPDYAESFDDPDGSNWPAPWTIAGNVGQANLVDGEARLRPSTSGGTGLARMTAATPTEDVDVTFAFRMEDASTQGIGVYVRQNGGFLTETNPNGQGYAVFLEGTFRNRPGISLWKEEDGEEIELLNGGNGDPVPVSGVTYRVRFRVTRASSVTTNLQAKFWNATVEEPSGWQIVRLDDTIELQETEGGIAIDSYRQGTSNPTTAQTIVDDLRVLAVCDDENN